MPEPTPQPQPLSQETFMNASVGSVLGLYHQLSFTMDRFIIEGSIQPSTGKAAVNMILQITNRLIDEAQSPGLMAMRVEDFLQRVTPHGVGYSHQPPVTA